MQHTQTTRLYLRSSLLLTVFLLLCYGNTLHVPWHLDDPPNITNNAPLRIDNLMPETIRQTLYAKPFAPGVLYRPIANFSFALNWYFGQDNPFGYHLVNLIIHILASLFLFQTILLLFQTPALHKYSSEDAWFIALLAATLWAINPIQTQAITYIVQRMASLAAMFYIWAMYWYLRFRLTQTKSRSRLYLFLCGLCYLLSVGSKENGAMLPLSLMALEFVFFPRPEDVFGKNIQKILLLITGTIIVCAIYYIFSHHYINYLFRPMGSRPFSLYERLLTEPAIILFYLSLIFYPPPQRFSVDHGVTIAHSLFGNWTTIPSILVITGLLILAIRQRKKMPLLSFAILFFFINHLVESTIIPLELIFEHRNYLPSMFLFLPVAAGLLYLLKQYAKRSRVIHAAIIFFIPFILFTTGWSTYARNDIWRSEKALWLDAIHKAPDNARGYAKLGELAGWNPEKSPQHLALAIGYYQKALTSYSPRTSFKAAILGNMGEVYLMYGRYNQAIVYYKKSLALNPHFNNSQYGLAKALVMQGKFDQALSVIAKSLQENHDQSRFLNLGGLVLLRLNKPEGALWSIQQAMKISGNKEKYFYNLGVALSKTGHYHNSEWFLRRAEKQSPQNIEIVLSLLENSIRAKNEKQINHYCQRLYENFSLPIINYYAKTIHNNFRLVPISTEIIIPVLNRYLRQHIRRLTSQPEHQPQT